MISKVIGTPAKPVQRSLPMASITTRGYMKRGSQNTEPPAKRCVCSRLFP